MLAALLALVAESDPTNTGPFRRARPSATRLCGCRGCRAHRSRERHLEHVIGASWSVAVRGTVGLRRVSCRELEWAQADTRIPETDRGRRVRFS
jgi:hypothetical protein